MRHLADHDLQRAHVRRDGSAALAGPDRSGDCPSGADVVCLQELDVFRDRTGYRDQAQDIARHLEMECHFHPAWQLEEEKYGDAVLSRYPIRVVKTGSLPATKEHREPRGAIWVEVILDEEVRIQLLNTHLSLYPNERALQARSLVSDEWIGRSNRAWPHGSLRRLQRPPYLAELPDTRRTPPRCSDFRQE